MLYIYVIHLPIENEVSDFILYAFTITISDKNQKSSRHILNLRYI